MSNFLGSFNHSPPSGFLNQNLMLILKFVPSPDSLRPITSEMKDLKDLREK